MDGQAGEDPNTSRPWRTRADLALVAIALLLCAARPHSFSGDGGRRFAAFSTLLEHSELTDVKYSLIGPLFSSPLWLVGRLAGAERELCAYYNWLLLGLGLAGLYWLLRDVFERETLTRFLLLLVFATTLPQAQLHWGGEMFSAVSIAVGLAALVTRRDWLGAVLVVLGTANTPTTLVATGAATLYLSASRTRWRYLIIPVVAALLVMGEAWLRRGDPLASGYANDHGFKTVLPYSGLPGFSYPFLLGLVSILFSFGRGVAVFFPGLWLVPRMLRSPPKARTLGIALILAVAGLVVVYARWWAWYGGAAWGPRFFLLAAFPSSAALAVGLSHRDRPWLSLLTLGLLGWSFWVGVSGLVFENHGVGPCWRNRYALEMMCWYVPEFSGLIRPFIVPKSLSGSEIVTLALWTVVLSWTAFPLITTLVAPARQAGLRLVERVRDLRTWRF